MIEGAPRNPYQYFYKHSVPESERNGEACEILSTPVFESDYKDEGGEIANTVGPYEYKLTYSLLTDPEILSFLHTYKPPTQSARIFQADKFMLSDSRNPKARLGMVEIPADTIVLFCGQQIDMSSTMLIDRKVGQHYVLIALPISNPRAIVEALHELGHVVDEKTLEAEKREGIRRFQSVLASATSVGSERLMKERNAWAWALKRLKPFFNEKIDILSSDSLFPKKLVLDYAKQSCLWTYQKDNINKLSEEASINDYYRSELDWWKNDDWWDYEMDTENSEDDDKEINENAPQIGT